jgi:hypothetical protein
MISLSMDIEKVKSEIINWIKNIDDEQLINKIEELRFQEELKHGLTEAQKEAIIRSISILEEE